MTFRIALCRPRRAPSRAQVARGAAALRRARCQFPPWPFDAPGGLPAGCSLGRSARLQAAGWRGPALGCSSDARSAVSWWGGLQPTLRDPWRGRAAQAARPMQGARPRRPTPHPAPAQASASTQRAHRAPALPPARARHSAAFTCPRPPTRPCPRWVTRRRLKGGAMLTPKPFSPPSVPPSPPLSSPPSPPPPPVARRHRRRLAAPFATGHRDRRGRRSRRLSAAEPPPVAATAVNAVAPSAAATVATVDAAAEPVGGACEGGRARWEGRGPGEGRGVDSTPFGPRLFWLVCLRL